MKNTCIFCGGELLKKTKEHVIPEWLLEYTGDIKSKIKIPYYKYKEGNFHNLELKEYSFDKFVYPACEKCNIEYSLLEGRIKKNFY